MMCSKDILSCCSVSWRNQLFCFSPPNALANKFHFWVKSIRFSTFFSFINKSFHEQFISPWDWFLANLSCCISFKLEIITNLSSRNGAGIYVFWINDGFITINTHKISLANEYLVFMLLVACLLNYILFFFCSFVDKLYYIRCMYLCLHTNTSIKVFGFYLLI